MNEQFEKRGYLLEDFRLFHLAGQPTEKVELHYHEFHKVFLLISGSGGYTVAGNRYSLRSGDLVMVGSRCVHKPEFQQEYERIILYISPEFLRTIPEFDLSEAFSGENGHVLRLTEAAQARVISLAKELEQELSTEEPGAILVCRGLIIRLLVEIIRGFRDETALRPKAFSPKNHRIGQIMAYIEENLTAELSVEKLSEQFFISKYHMMRSFRQETGTTIHGYIQDRRLIQARSLINGGMRATEACYRAGFHSYASFTRAYSARFGTTPTGRPTVLRPAEETYE